MLESSSRSGLFPRERIGEFDSAGFLFSFFAKITSSFTKGDDIMTKLKALGIAVIIYIIFAIVFNAIAAVQIGWVVGGFALALATSIIFDSGEFEEEP